jgi:hypothetical protein
MQFSVIYSVDCPEDEHITRFSPPDLDLWDQAEGDDSYEYSYLEGRCENGSHRSGMTSSHLPSCRSTECWQRHLMVHMPSARK